MTVKPQDGGASEPAEFRYLATKEEQALKVTPFNEWTPNPITVPPPPSGPGVEFTFDSFREGLDGWSAKVLEQGRDSYGQRFVDMDIDPEVNVTHGQQHVPKAPKANIVPLADSWKIGHERSQFVEPEATSKSNYDM